MSIFVPNGGFILSPPLKTRIPDSIFNIPGLRFGKPYPYLASTDRGVNNNPSGNQTNATKLSPCNDQVNPVPMVLPNPLISATSNKSLRQDIHSVVLR